MKRIKKLASLLLAMVMALAMSVTVFAAGETGSITISNTTKDAKYNVYRIFNLDSYVLPDEKVEGDKGRFPYYIAENWAGFFAEGGAGADYVTKTSVQGGKTYVLETTITEANAGEFAKAALAYAKTNNIANDGSAVGTANDGTVVIGDLPLGYYLLDSNVGTVCSLNTLTPNITIMDKNQHPGNEKEVEEDSNGRYGNKNDADITQTVNFRSTITIPAAEGVNNNAVGVENLVFHDSMEEGFTWNKDSVSVTLTRGDTTTTVDSSSYEVKAAPGHKTTDMEACTFDVVFTEAFNNALQPNDVIVISYSAVLNEKAVIAGDGNLNDSKVTFGEPGENGGFAFETTPSQTVTKTWQVEIFKHDSADTGLEGAIFTLSKAEDGSNPISFVKEGNEEVYRLAKEDETGSTQITTVTGGKFVIKGLDSDTYYLTETKAPTGFNELAEPIEIKIDDKGNITYSGEKDASTGENTMLTATVPAGGTAPQIPVLNQSGSLLPSTGGIGTTIFYTVGGILVAAAGILLVVKKRMSAR